MRFFFLADNVLAVKSFAKDLVKPSQIKDCLSTIEKDLPLVQVQLQRARLRRKMANYAVAGHIKGDITDIDLTQMKTEGPFWLGFWLAQKHPTLEAPAVEQSSKSASVYTSQAPHLGCSRIPCTSPGKAQKTAVLSGTMHLLDAARRCLRHEWWTN